MSYQEFLSSKRLVVQPSGIDVPTNTINQSLFDFQQDIVRWALRKGSAAVFAGTGLGKTAMQLEWARHIHENTGNDVLVLAPLAVAEQTVREGRKFNIIAKYCHSQDDVEPGITVTNYERLHRFNTDHFGAVVLDESSILKAYDGSTRTLITESFASTPYKLACTATPAPNDYMELGNHAEFLGVMSRAEMLSMFFVHDGGETQKWRLKGHAETEFWRWVCSWAVMLTNPYDLGYDGSAFDLPSLTYHRHVIESQHAPEGYLFPVEGRTLNEQRAARKASLPERVARCAEIVNATVDPWIIWCDLNSEADALCKAIPDAVQVAGSDDADLKEARLLGFVDGDFRVLVTKPSIAGHGMNFQHCHNVAFVGVSHSWEQYYQAIRRCWRFGQSEPVECHVITSTAEGAVVSNLERKERDAERMQREMVSHMSELNQSELKATERLMYDYAEETATGNGWTMHLGDSVEIVGAMDSDSIDYSIFSPPFASLYTYSNSTRDMGNVRTHSEFYQHFMYLVEDLYRVLKPGRLLSFHCMNIPTSKSRDGFIGISDFRGHLIRMFTEAGFIYHSEVVIWKDPVTAMQRTKALGLLYKQLKKDSAMSRQGIPDYLVTVRKPGVNPEPVTKDPDEFPVHLWQQYASPVWHDINPSDTLQKESAREHKDERHIAPLQLQVIRRALELWTNPSDLVLDPFMGIGSTGYEAIKMGRRAIGVELKRSYWQQAVANLRHAETESEQPDLFTVSGVEVAS